jgi:hypothetical protein
MIKKIVLAAFILSFTVSCKEDALSKVDPNSQDVDMNTVTSITKNGDASVPAEGDLIEAQPQVTNGKFPAITFNKKEHDFGEIKEGANVETVFIFTNTGDADLIISDAKGSCGCTVPEFPKEPIKPGKTGKMKVSFDSAGKPGMQQKSVNITCNTQQGSDVLSIKANVLPKESAVTATPVNQ